MGSKFLNLDTDTTLGGANSSDTVVASQKAVKIYVDSQAGAAPSFSNLTGDPYDNTNLANALNAKVDDVTVNGTSIVTSGVANIINMVTTDTAQDITDTKTFKAQQTFQSGDASGALVIGADVGETTLTNNTRKLGRVTLPPKALANPNVAIISADTQAFNAFSVLPTGYTRADTNTISFGSAPGDTTSTAPDLLGFTVAKTHNATATADKILAIEISKEQAKFNVQPNYNGDNLLTANDIPVNDVTVNGTTIVSSGTAVIPIAALDGDYGLVKLGTASYGLKIDASGRLVTSYSSTSDIDSKTSYYKPITPLNLDYAVKVGVTTNTINLTATEKTNACSWLGASQVCIKRVWSET